MSGLPEMQYAHDQQTEKKQKRTGRPKKEIKPAEKKAEQKRDKSREQPKAPAKRQPEQKQLSSKKRGGQNAAPQQHFDAEKEKQIIEDIQTQIEKRLSL